jgi:hypothetical protein
MSSAIDYTGLRLGHSVVLGRADTDEAASYGSSNGSILWTVRCGCGQRFVRRGTNIGTAQRHGGVVLCDTCGDTYRNACRKRVFGSSGFPRRTRGAE